MRKKIMAYSCDLCGLGVGSVNDIHQAELTYYKSEPSIGHPVKTTETFDICEKCYKEMLQPLARKIQDFHQRFDEIKIMNNGLKGEIM